MTPLPPEKPRRRMIALGEFIAIAALIISALGLWNSWQSGKTGPTEVVERKEAVPLVLRGKLHDDGKAMTISPIESSHSVQQLILRFPNKDSINLDGDGELSARELMSVLGRANETKGPGSTTVVADARFVEFGKERDSSRRYRIAYRIDGGGLFGGHSLRITGFTAA